MKRDLIICNTVYQVLVALWLQKNELKDHMTDIVVSDHMNSGEKIFKELCRHSDFNNCYYVKSFDYTRYKENTDFFSKAVSMAAPKIFLKKYISINKKYDNLFVANLDIFSKLVFSALVSDNKSLKTYIFEDGLVTYSVMYETYIKACYPPERNGIKQFICTKLIREKYLIDHIKGIFLFNPEMLAWKPAFSVFRQKKIDIADKDFTALCNKIFDYNNSDRYDTKYIFMEESYYAENVKINDVELVEQIAKKVGKDNIMVKIHPRNKVNRFSEKGFKTNMNTSVPWEVILMNIDDLSEKTLITIASGSILNPILIFGKRIKAYSLYELTNPEIRSSSFLTGPLWELVSSIFKKYPEMIKICKNIEEIE